jgi:hypothetical protein
MLPIRSPRGSISQSMCSVFLPKRGAALLLPALALALAALWAEPAFAGRGAHRSRRLGGHQRQVKHHARHAPARSAPAGTR